MIDILGYVGMVIVLISFMFKDLTRMRILNSVGCIVSVVYAIYTATLPTALMNAGILAINITMLLIDFKKGRKHYE